MDLSTPEALALGFGAGLALHLLLARFGRRKELPLRASAPRVRSPTPRPAAASTSAPPDTASVPRPSLAQSEREVAAVWLQFLRREVAETVGAINSRLTVAKTLLAGLAQGDLAAEQRDILERVQTELDRLAAATAELHGQVSSAAPAPARPSVTTARPHAPRTGVLLVVESDDTTRDVLGRLLSSAGHHVIPARDGIEAFAVLQEEPVECVICETRVSRLSGEGLYTQVEQRLPHLARRFVFISGDTQQSDVRDFLERSGRPVIPKPFDVDALVEAVHEVLEVVQTGPRSL